MPRLSYFYGIAVYIYWDDHNPPHYHATYGEAAWAKARANQAPGTIEPLP